jgi:hypothetical protein
VYGQLFAVLVQLEEIRAHAIVGCVGVQKDVEVVAEPI